MSCTVCASKNQSEFSAEVMIHFSGYRNINNPGVVLVPKVCVCLDCGFAKFIVPEAELEKLKSGNARSMTAS
jgi:hypothetical protein